MSKRKRKFEAASDAMAVEEEGGPAKRADVTGDVHDSYTEEFEDPHLDEQLDMDEEAEEEEEQEEVTYEEFMQNPVEEPNDPDTFFEEELEAQGTRVFRPGIDQLGEGEVLDYDPAAYVMMHALTVEWPCLSFDVLRDHLGNDRTTFPHTMYWAAGTQADRADRNRLFVIKATQLYKTQNDGEEDVDGFDMEGGDSDDEDGDAVIDFRYLDHVGSVNRVRSMPQQSTIVGTWSDTGVVSVYDLSAFIESLERPGARAPKTAHDPLFQFNGHTTEGYALDWSPSVKGRFVTGDCNNLIYLWNPTESSWNVDPAPYAQHTASVEDLQWHPSEDTVFCSCSADQTLRVWDIRQKGRAVLHTRAHNSDVNVLSWNPAVEYLMLTGADDGSFRIWDLRNLSNKVADFQWHKAPITSIEWNPNEESALAVASADDQITLWDMSLEKDSEEQSMEVAENFEVPPQLLFIHQGQTEIKELHWHPQVPGTILSTAENGFNVFRTINS